MRFFVTALLLVFLSSCTHTYYIARHAEKEAAGPNMISDVPLTRAGRERAEQLKDVLSHEHIHYVYSTDFIRTKSTAQRTADYFSLPVILYGPRVDSTFIKNMKALRKNVLIVGHSNTVDDIVNGLMGKKMLNDLDDSEYNRLFIIKMKGKRAKFEEQKIYR